MNTGIMFQAAQRYARVYEFTLTTKPEDAQGAAGVYTWTPPLNCVFLEFFIVGGGGGGGAGARQALGVNRRGGGAGSASAITWVTCSRSFFTSPLAITIGTGGAGGAGATADNTAPSIGTAGTSSIISMNGVQILSAGGGNGAQANGNAALGATQGTIASTQVGTSSVTAYTSPAATQTGVPPGGGGGSASNLNAYIGGQTISPHGIPFFYDRRYQGVLGAPATYAGGGDCAAGVAGGAGADGLFYGSPGSGGGASDNGFVSGKGGNGSGGYIRIVCF